MRVPRSRPLFALSLSWILLCVLLGALWLAGGASRGDVLGQAVVRGVSAIVLIVAILFGDRPILGRARPVALLLGAAIVLVLLQLVPLPPAIWQALPGRAMLEEAAAASGQAQPWRPWSIVPGATVNAAASLIVPAAALLLVTGLEERERSWLPGLMLALVGASMLLGLLQFSGAGFDNPFINETPGVVSGSFSNRNHFALFLALGCLLVPAWMFVDGRRARWRGPTGLGLVLLFLLTILASGSRTGILLGILALGIGLALAWRGIGRELRTFPRWVFPALIAASVALVALFVSISVSADRAVSIDRMLAADTGEDLRGRALPTVLAMIRVYFPAGSGFGGFDPVFRIHEPFGFLNLTYFNHAHNDLLEVVLDGGLPGLLLMLGTLLWWARASLRAWRTGRGAHHLPARLGSAMLLLVLVASLSDYPARTPVIMATIVIAAWWLSTVQRAGPALPPDNQHL